MRPAVHASFLRNRSQPVRRVMRPHSFSMRRLLVIACVGAIFFIPGIVLCIVGLEKQKEANDNEESRPAVYQALGPAFATLGGAIFFAACVYYYCYGADESNRLPGGSHQSSINSDQLHHQHSRHSHHGPHGHHHDHRNGHQLNVLDGSIRRPSLKSEQHSPARTPVPKDQEQMPLAPTKNTGSDSQETPPQISILVDEAPDSTNEDQEQGREPLVNGEIPHDDPSNV